MKNITFKNYLQLILVYFVILLQYPFGIAVGKFVFNLNFFENIQPSYLLLWGAFRIFVVLPLVFFLLTSCHRDEESIYLQLGNKKRMTALTFWSTLIFTILGIFLYPFFVNQTALTIQKFIYLFPIFSLYAISNAFVEEVFFRGVALSILTENMRFWVANIIQAFFFAGIHFFVPVNDNVYMFVLLTFALGLLWGWLTRKTKSLIPAIVFHMVADVFLAISLF